jgi:ATP-dependent helicase/nuclease subunit A
VQDWVELCEPLLAPDDEFSRLRLAQCQEAALALVARGEDDLDVLLAHLAGYTLREHDAPGQVAVMTIHKAKGLDWDLVILPQLEGNDIRKSPGDLLVSRDASGEVAWVLQAPTVGLAAADPTLDRHYSAHREDQAFESLCALYVGLTRAKRALYVIAHPPGAKRESVNLPCLLHETLGGETPAPLALGAGEPVPCTWQCGRFDWFESLPVQAASPAASAPDPGLPAAERRETRPPRALRPSAEGPARLPAAALLGDGEDRAELGTAVHTALEAVAWLDPPPAAGADLFAEAPAAARELLRTALGTPAIRELFNAPPGPHRLARELPFEVRWDDQWISGKIDRLVIHLDEQGRPRAAEVIDFKTDRLADAEALAAAVQRHRPQLETYRACVARLYGMPEEAVRLHLVFLAATPPTVVG